LKQLVFAFGALLAGCTTASMDSAPATSFVGPNGERGYSIACNGNAQNVGVCLKKAGQLCPSGYSIVGRDEIDQPYRNPVSGRLEPHMLRNLQITCKR
jgi:hypothetical protein